MSRDVLINANRPRASTSAYAITGPRTSSQETIRASGDEWNIAPASLKVAFLHPDPSALRTAAGVRCLEEFLVVPSAAARWRSNCSPNANSLFVRVCFLPLVVADQFRDEVRLRAGVLAVAVAHELGLPP